MRIGFDNDKYIRTQSEHIRKRLSQFGGKLYLEFGGKLFDDNYGYEFFHFYISFKMIYLIIHPNRRKIHHQRVKQRR